jgi:hypothetical protein
VVRNCENALKKAGGSIVQIDQVRWVNGKIVKDGQEVWVEVQKPTRRIGQALNPANRLRNARVGHLRQSCARLRQLFGGM